MNTISKYYKISLIFGLLLFFNACEQEDNLRFTQPEGVFELDVPPSPNIFLNFSVPENPAFTINWVDEVTGANEYVVEMSITQDFENAVVLGTSTENTFTMSVSDFNSSLSQANIESFDAQPIFMRVLADGTESNVINFSVNKFPEKKPVIESPHSSFSVVLSGDMSGDEAITISWNDPEFSDDNPTEVNYSVEASIAGTDFENVQLMGMTDENNLSLTHFELNEVALDAGLEATIQGSLDVRVSSIVETTNGDIERVSDAITIDVTPYSGPLTNLFMVGAATAPGWNNDNNNPALVRDPNDPNVFTYTGRFLNGQFKILEQRGDWQPQWGVGPDGNLASSEDLGEDPGVFEIDGGEGYYTMDLNLSDNTYSIVPFDESSAATYSTIGIIGSATPNGWNSDTDLTQSSFDPHLWYMNGLDLVDGEAKFRAGDAWDTNWGSDTELTGFGSFDGPNIPVEGGTYDIWFNDLDGSYVFILNED